MVFDSMPAKTKKKKEKKKLNFHKSHHTNIIVQKCKKFKNKIKPEEFHEWC